MRITNKEFKQLTDYIYSNFGICMTEEKKVLLTSRLSKIISEKGFNRFEEYYNYIKNDKNGKAVAELVDRITTNHTFFFREKEHFLYFEKEVLPYLKKIESSRKDLRIWSAGCSTGEEPYTLAMILNTFFKEDNLKWDTKILATDISQRVLRKAEKGVYTEDEIKLLPNIMKLNSFNKIGKDRYEVSKQIKDEVIFRRFNLMNEFPFKDKFHVIFCRNVMIYFDSKTKNELVDKFYRYLKPGGYMFIGHSETIDRRFTKFKYIKPAVYRKE